MPRSVPALDTEQFAWARWRAWPVGLVKTSSRNHSRKTPRSSPCWTGSSRRPRGRRVRGPARRQASRVRYPRAVSMAGDRCARHAGDRRLPDPRGARDRAHRRGQRRPRPDRPGRGRRGGGRPRGGVNCAAWTAVDDAEATRTRRSEINATAPGCWPGRARGTDAGWSSRSAPTTSSPARRATPYAEDAPPTRARRTAGPRPPASRPCAPRRPDGTSSSAPPGCTARTAPASRGRSPLARERGAVERRRRPVRPADVDHGRRRPGGAAGRGRRPGRHLARDLERRDVLVRVRPAWSWSAGLAPGRRQPRPTPRASCAPAPRPAYSCSATTGSRRTASSRSGRGRSAGSSPPQRSWRSSSSSRYSP